MKSILSLVGMAIALDNYAKSLEVESKELDIARSNVKRASLFLHKLQKEFTDSVGSPADFDVQDVNVLDFGIKIAELKEDIEAHVKSLDIANQNYARLINNALSAIEEAELWFDEYYAVAKRESEEKLLNGFLVGNDPIMFGKISEDSNKQSETLSFKEDAKEVEAIRGGKTRRNPK